ncbi:hypothetical protein J6590_072041 [Homalodisca vitripennis]|nr:hypothetical protein J6590_072041 [Homalodisca vitripennis]
MELAHVDLLPKKELIFEINFRGGNASESDTVQNLRKMLRSLLKLNIRANAGNLKGRIEPSTALKEIKVDLEALSVKIGNLSEEKSTGEYLRLVCRHKHLTVRVDVLCELYKWEGARLLLTRRGAGTLFVQLDRQSADRSVTYRVMRSSRLAGGAVSLVLAIEEYV